MKRLLALACTAALLGGPGMAHEFGFAGILSKSNKEDLPELTLSVGKPIAAEPLKLKSGMAYEIEIVADGTGELALEGAGFFRAIWVNEVVVNGLEIRPYGIDSLEFDEAGTMEIEFVAIKPGRYELKQPGSTGESQRVEIIIE
ncbi:cupredoxin domain-containing protein [Sedimentitalea todarodis]|uniref:Copper-binding protein n=1 Tax=Sedimentitalea todarodis TaxID=1631240 RepID=A0ABU3VG22_9RHOB|nr:hypothetical protein [Sedimentitalea todarodis]MDU9005134.1 hypothetical protein [Sedimentitalea todarodis]